MVAIGHVSRAQLFVTGCRFGSDQLRSLRAELEENGHTGTGRSLSTSSTSAQNSTREPCKSAVSDKAYKTLSIIDIGVGLTKAGGNHCWHGGLDCRLDILMCVDM